LKIGPILRRERDTRSYQDLFQSSRFEIHGARRVRLLLSASRVEAVRADVSPDGVVVEVRGIEGLFTELIREHDLVKARLLAMTRPAILERVSGSRRNAVAIHVRLGDFAPAVGAYARAAHASSNTRTPIDWYRHVVLHLCSELPEDVRFIVFSDGSDAELAPLLQLRRVERRPSKDALSDLLEMANCRGLVASGSTYSMWASYLGRLPTIWPPGQMRQRFMVDDELEFEYAQGSLPEPLVRYIASDTAR
jgi:hypothetical protein